MTNNKDLCGNESILFVDDESFIVHVQQKVFERYGYSVTPFVSSLDALNEFKARPGIFDIVICDMAMPIMTGLELAHRIKQISLTTRFSPWKMPVFSPMWDQEQ